MSADIEVALRQARCGGCGARVGVPINLIGLDRLATWDFPRIGTVMGGRARRAVGVLCSACLDAGGYPKEAIEFDPESGEVHYHAVDTLDEAPPTTLH
jgi:hypothetical protein